MRQSSIKIFAAAVTAATVLACGRSGPTGPDGVGSAQFKAELRELTTSGVGQAIYGGFAAIDVDSTTLALFALVLTDGSSQPGVYFAFAGIPSPLPDSVEYEIVAASSDAQLGPGQVRLVSVTGVGASAAAAVSILDASGTLTFDATHGTGDPRGTFAFTGSVPQVGSSGLASNVAVRGGFDAALGDVVLAGRINRS